MRRMVLTALAGASLLASTAVAAKELTVQIVNLTNASYFTPLLVGVHPGGVQLFRVGQAASPELQALAEGGDTSGLADQVEMAGGKVVLDPAGGVLGPGERAEATFKLRGRHTRFLSLASMVLPTNDGFIGINSLRVPSRPGRYVLNLPVYDAGTEANDEIVNGGGAPGVPGIPADPGGLAGTGATGAAGPDVNQTVHVHRGVLGDDDPAAGPSDLDRSAHRWQNPVARVVLVVRGDDDRHDRRKQRRHKRRRHHHDDD